MDRVSSQRPHSAVTTVVVAITCLHLMAVSAVALPAPPSGDAAQLTQLADGLDTGKSLDDFQRNSRSPVTNNSPSTASAVATEPNAHVTTSAAAGASDVNFIPIIQPATLVTHIKSEGNKPFKSVDGSGKRVTSRPRQNNPSVTDSNVIRLSVAPAAKPQTTVLPIRVQNAGKSFPDDDLFDSPNAFTLPNFQTVSNPPIAPIFDVNDVDDDDLLLLELLGSRMNKAGFGAEQRITPAVRLGSSLNLGTPTSTRKSPSRRQKQRGNSISLGQAGHSRASSVPGIFSDEDKIVIDLAAIGSRGTPLPLLTGNSNNQGNFFTGKEISAGNTVQQSIRTSNSPSPTLLNDLGPQIDSQMTVGDLIRSLDGLNGIQVLSLSDLRKQHNLGSPVSSTGTTIAEHLRAAMLSKNTGIGSQTVGVPLPILVASNSLPSQGAVQVASEIPGRQLDQTGFESDTVFDNFFDESTGTSGTAGGVGIPLSAVADNAASTATTSGSLTTVLDDTNGFPLEENTDFNFQEYEDDLDDLPPQPESVFRRGISDIFFTKGQWLGTLFGGIIDIGSSIGDSVSKLFNKPGRNSTAS